MLACDAGELDPSVLQLSAVRFVRGLVECSEFHALLQQHSADIRLVVCDINVFPKIAASLLREHVLKFMKHGILVLTFKMQKNPSARSIAAAEAQVTSILRDIGGYDFKIVHLAANSKNERTLCCRIGITAGLSRTGPEGMCPNPESCPFEEL